MTPSGMPPGLLRACNRWTISCGSRTENRDAGPRPVRRWSARSCPGSVAESGRECRSPPGRRLGGSRHNNSRWPSSRGTRPRPPPRESLAAMRDDDLLESRRKPSKSCSAARSPRCRADAIYPVGMRGHEQDARALDHAPQAREMLSCPGQGATFGRASRAAQNLIIALRVSVTLLVTPTQLPLARWNAAYCS